MTTAGMRGRRVLRRPLRVPARGGGDGRRPDRGERGRRPAAGGRPGVHGGRLRRVDRPQLDRVDRERWRRFGAGGPTPISPSSTTTCRRTTGTSSSRTSPPRPRAPPAPAGRPARVGGLVLRAGGPGRLGPPRPLVLRGALAARRAPGSSCPTPSASARRTGDARAALAAQADADWTSFLASRAIDLAPGGRLIVQVVGTDLGDPEAGPRVTARRPLRAMTDVARDLVHAGALSRTAFERYLLPAYARTVDEALAPLRRARSPVAQAFEVVACRTDPVANPYLERWAADGDGRAYARTYAAFVRAFTESSLRDGLFAPGALGGRRPADLLDDYFARLAERFAPDPERDRFEDWTLTVVLQRRGRPA